MKGFVLRANAEEVNSFNSEVNYKTACKNFDLTKEKLNAILRSHACKDVDYYECEQQLGLGKMGLITLGAGAMEAAALTAHAKVRNPNFVMCAVSQAPIFHFKMGPFWPSVAYAKCYDYLSSWSQGLRHDIQENLRKIDDLITQQKNAMDIIDKDKKVAVLSEKEAKKGLEELNNTNRENSLKIKGLFAEVSELKAEKSGVSKDFNEWANQLQKLRNNPTDNGAITKEAYKKSYDIFLNEGVRKNFITPEQASNFNKLLSSEFNTSTKQLIFLEKLNLEKLIEKKKISEQLFEEFTRNSAISSYESKNLRARAFFDIIDKFNQSEAFTDQFKKRLDYFSKELIEKYETELVGFNRSMYALSNRASKPIAAPLKIRKYSELPAWFSRSKLLKSSLGVITSMGAMTAASASEVEGVAGVLDLTDPLYITYKALSVGSAGDCKAMNSMVPRDPNNNCQIINEMNDELFKTFSEADNEELESLFGSQEVCGYIQGTYEKNYPKVKSKNLTCSSPKPWNLEFENKTKLVIQSDKVELSGAELAGTLQYDLSAAKTVKPIVIKEYGETFRVAHQWHRNVLPDYRKIWQQMKVSAIEMVSCCSDGVTPSESECARYGIKSKSTDGAGKDPAAGQK